MGDFFVVHSSSLPSTARVMGFLGTEGISRPYEFDVYLRFSRGEGAEVDLSDTIGGKLYLEIPDDAAGASSFLFSGAISEIELLEEEGLHSVFRVRFVPQLWRLGLAMHSRVFTAKSVPEILASVFDDNGMAGEYELRLTSAYAIEEHVTQYRESDLAFVSRWMEREGIYYFFEHTREGEKLVLVDDLASHHALDARPVRFHPATDDESAGESLHYAALQRSAMPARVLVSDYDYLKPGLGITGSGAVSENGLGDMAYYGDRVFSPADARRVARIRAEALKAHAEIFTARGTKKRLRPGYLFELDDHPRRELTKKWLATQVEHVGRALTGTPEVDALVGPVRDTDTAVYRVQVKGISADVQYRDTRRTPWPRIFGFENATVDGATSSTYAQIDDHGRYAIKLRFDEGPLKGGSASTWVRMAQPHAGGLEGFHFPLRKGTEVLVEFLDGDPDRPVIAAVLPNAATPSPVTASNHTKNVIQTGGSTRTEIEDAAGGQYAHHTTPPANTSLWMGTDATSKGGHNVEHSTDGSGGKSFGSYFDRFVGGAKAEQVVGDVVRNYDSSYKTSVAGHVQQIFQSNQASTIIQNVTRNITGTLTESVTQAVKQGYDSAWSHFVTLDVGQTFLSNHGVKIGGTQDVKVTAKGDMTDDKGLAVTVNAALSKHVATAGYKLEAVPKATFHVKSNVAIRADVAAVLSAPATTVDGDTSIDSTSGATTEVKSKSVSVVGTSSIAMSGAKIDILGGEVSIEGGTISYAATGNMDVSSKGALVAAAGGVISVDGGPKVTVTAGVIQLNLNGAAASGLGVIADMLFAMDPAALNQLIELQKAGWTIQYGEPGKGSYFDKEKKIIVLDGNLKKDPAAAFAKLSELQDDIAHPKTPILRQEEPNSCVVAASRMIIDTQTGQDLPESGLRTESSGMKGGYDPKTGTYYNTADDLMHDHGVSGASEYRPLTVDDLQTATANGDPALVSISHHDADGKRTGGHALVVDSVTTNPDGTRTIHIRDPENDNPVSIPEDQFKNDYYGSGSGKAVSTFDGMGITTDGSG